MSTVTTRPHKIVIHDLMRSLGLKNTKRNDFRIVVGLIRLLAASHLTKPNDWKKTREYVFVKTNAFGGNMQRKNTYSISPDIKIAAKVFTQPYFIGDIDSGILIKAGMSF